MLRRFWFEIKSIDKQLEKIESRPNSVKPRRALITNYAQRVCGKKSGCFEKPLAQRVRGSRRAKIKSSLTDAGLCDIARRWSSRTHVSWALAPRLTLGASNLELPARSESAYHSRQFGRYLGNLGEGAARTMFVL